MITLARVAALEELGLTGRATHNPGEVSGGERQRVAIARDRRPAVVAHDPSGAPDPASADDVVVMIREACQQGVATVVVTHDAHLASWADRVVFLGYGHLVGRAIPDAPDSQIRPARRDGPVADTTLEHSQ